MSRYVFTLWSKADRERAVRVIAAAPTGSRIEVKAAKRTIPQNDRMWTLLSKIAMRATLHGAKRTPNEWKAVFMTACGHEMRFLPTLDGKSFFPLGHRSSDLSKGEMSDLMEFISAWAAENGIDLGEPGEAAA